MTRLVKGDEAPDFELKDGEGHSWRLADHRGQKLIVYFYPADDTPGCTSEACDFRDAQEDLREAGYEVVGISPQDETSHRSFSSRYALNFPLLVDDRFTVAEMYGARAETESSWHDIPLKVTRSTFVIDEDGRVVEALYGVRGKGHVGSLREALEI